MEELYRRYLAESGIVHSDDIQALFYDACYIGLLEDENREEYAEEIEDWFNRRDGIYN
jgi:hypothetical protein